MKVRGVPTGSRLDDVIAFTVLEGEARTWYDLRVRPVQSEIFETYTTLDLWQRSSTVVWQMHADGNYS